MTTAVIDTCEEAIPECHELCLDPNNVVLLHNVASPHEAVDFVDKDNRRGELVGQAEKMSTEQPQRGGCLVNTRLFYLREYVVSRIFLYPMFDGAAVLVRHIHEGTYMKNTAAWTGVLHETGDCQTSSNKYGLQQANVGHNRRTLATTTDRLSGKQ